MEFLAHGEKKDPWLGLGWSWRISSQMRSLFFISVFWHKTHLIGATSGVEYTMVLSKHMFAILLHVLTIGSLEVEALFQKLSKQEHRIYCGEPIT